MSRILVHKMHMTLQLTESKIIWGSADIKTRFHVLQNGLINVPCHGPVVKQICSQLIKEQVFDFLALQKFRGSPDDLYDLVMMFMNREPEDVYKFLDILMNINKFPILSAHFRNVIKKLVIFPKENNKSLKLLNSNQYNKGNELMMLKRSVSSLSVLPVEEVQYDGGEKCTNFKRKAEVTVSCPDLMTFGYVVDDFKENKKPKVSQMHESSQKKPSDHVSIEISTISDNSTSSQTFETQDKAIDQENKPLLNDISTRPKIKAMRLSTKLKIMGAAAGIGVLACASGFYPQSVAITENTSVNTTSVTNNFLPNNVRKDTMKDNLNVVEREVNASLHKFKYNFA